MTAVLTACGGEPTSSSGEGAKSVSKVNFGVASGSSNIAFAPHWAAVESGALDRALDAHGARMEQQTFSSGPPLIAAVAAGQIDLAIVPTNVALALAAKRRPVMAVFHLSTGGSAMLVGASKFQSSRGTDIAKYDRANWGYSGEGSTTQLVARIVAENAGLAWTNQKGIALGPTSALEPALKAGRAEIASIDPDGAASAIASGTGYLVFNSNVKGSPLFPYALAGTSVIARRQFVEQRPEVVAAVVKAELEGLAALKEAAKDPERVRKLLPKASTEGEWAAKWQLVAPAFEQATGVFSEDVLAQSAALAELGSDEKIPPEVIKDAVTNEFVTKAYRDLDLPTP
jgi:sulfonate transport system substrate-binding protein